MYKETSQLPYFIIEQKLQEKTECWLEESARFNFEI